MKKYNKEIQPNEVSESLKFCSTWPFTSNDPKWPHVTLDDLVKNKFLAEIWKC